MNDPIVPPRCDPALLRHVLRLLKSYNHWTGRDLIDPSGPPESLAERLFAAPFIVISHGTEEDPILNYGNRAALRLWEMSWEAFTRTPSRQTAEAQNREERARFLEAVARNGFIENYGGIRISSTGRRFRIEEATVWNLLDKNDRYRGQAATFPRWINL